jgi:hypothetical protein
MNKLICHMTHIDNLIEILRVGGLQSKNSNSMPNYKSIANESVQDKRAARIVPIGVKGTLHDYVPFYFWGVTPMLLVNKYRQNDIIFLVSETKTISEARLPFVFTDRHAYVKYAKFYDDLNNLNELNWEIIKSTYWESTPEDPDRMTKKQAEFLVYQQTPWPLISGIGVINEEVAAKVTAVVGNHIHRPLIKVKKEWYYL